MATLKGKHHKQLQNIAPNFLYHNTGP